MSTAGCGPITTTTNSCLIVEWVAAQCQCGCLQGPLNCGDSSNALELTKPQNDLEKTVKMTNPDSRSLIFCSNKVVATFPVSAFPTHSLEVQEAGPLKIAVWEP